MPSHNVLNPSPHHVPLPQPLNYSSSRIFQQQYHNFQEINSFLTISFPLKRTPFHEKRQPNHILQYYSNALILYFNMMSIISLFTIYLMIIDKNKYLPDWKEAEIHGKASRVGFYKEKSTNFCECCKEKIDKQQIPICENTKSLEFLGFGFPLFYMFIRNCIILLILLIISNNLISLFISIHDGNDYCGSRISHPATVGHPEHSMHEMFARHSIAHWNTEALSEVGHGGEHGGQGKVGVGQQGEPGEDPNLYLSCKCRNFMLLLARTDKMQKDYEIIFRVGSFIIHVLALLYIKDKIIKTWEYYDEMESDLSDYAVLVKRIPPNLSGIKGRINQFISKELKFQGKKYNVHEIILIPQSNHVHHLHEQEEHAIEHYLHAREIKDPHADHLFQEIEKIHHKKQEIVQRTIAEINEDTIEAKNAIIIFETEPEKEQFLEDIETMEELGVVGKYFGHPKKDLVIIEAPEPREINYENLPYEYQKVKNICIGWSLSLLFLAIITVIFYFIQLLKTNNLVEAIEQAQINPSEAHGRIVFANVIAWVTLLGIVFFNKFVMGNVLHYFTHLEKHDNKANEDFSFAFKYALGMFFTTAIMTILVEALKYKNYYKHDFGVIEQETIMFFLCAFLVPLIWAIHPLQLCHKYERSKHYGNSDVSQHEANHLMADYHYDMGKRYAEIIEMMWFTFLYADLIPIGAFLILIGFCIYYWVDKYNLLRRSSLEGNISGDLATKALFLLDLTLIWRFLGEIIFDVQIRQGVHTLSIIFLSLSVVYMLIPWEAFLQLVNSEKFKLNNKTFTEEKSRFQYDNYRVYHPVYSQVAHDHKHQIGEQDIVANDLMQFAHNLPSKPLLRSNPSSILIKNSSLSTYPSQYFSGIMPNSPSASSKPKISFQYK